MWWNETKFTYETSLTRSMVREFALSWCLESRLFNPNYLPSSEKHKKYKSLIPLFKQKYSIESRIRFSLLDRASSSIIDIFLRPISLLSLLDGATNLIYLSNQPLLPSFRVKLKCPESVPSTSSSAMLLSSCSTSLRCVPNLSKRGPADAWAQEGWTHEAKSPPFANAPDQASLKFSDAAIAYACLQSGHDPGIF